MSDFPLSERLIDYTSGEATAASLDTIAAKDAIRLIAADDDLFNLEKKPFEDLAKNTLFYVPPYQRLYSWKQEQHREFWLEFEDLIGAHLEEDRDTEAEDVFFGTMFLAQEEESDCWEIIDGQQRLTTAVILLRCILKRLEEYDEGAVDGIELAEEKRKLRNIIYKETETGVKRNPSITLNKHDKDFFTHLMWDDVDCIQEFWSQDDIDGRKSEAYSLGKLVKKLRISEESIIEAGIKERDDDDPFDGEHRTVYDSNEKLIDAFVFYQNRLDEVLNRVGQGLEADGFDPQEATQKRKKREIIALLNITNYLKHSFHIGRFEITADESELRLKIFEILNSRGLELTDADKIRSAVYNFSKSPRAPDGLLEEWRKIELQFNTDSQAIERFIKTYLATTIDGVSSINTAGDYLIQAFSPRPDDDRTPVKSYLADTEDPKEELETLSRYAELYYQIAFPDELSGYSELSLSGSRPDVQRVYLQLRRLNSLAIQWHPSALAGYAVTSSESEQVSELVDLLHDIEIITLRRLIVGASPSEVEELHARGATEFWKWRETNEEEETVGSESAQSAFERLQSWLITDFRRRVSTAFGTTFIQTLVQQEDWSHDHMKGIWAKRTVENLTLDGMVPQSYNPDIATLEHILPSTPIRPNDSDPYQWLKVFFELDNPEVFDPSEELEDEMLDEYDEIQQEVIEYIRRYEDEGIDSEEDGEIERIGNLVSSRYIEELANTVILGSRDNKGIKNSHFAKKFYYYHRSESGFADLESNWYFTEEGPTIEASWIETIRDSVAGIDEDEDDFPDLDEVFDAATIEELNEFWTYREQVRRRLYEFPDVLAALEFDSPPEEIRNDISDVTTRQLQDAQHWILEGVQGDGIDVSKTDFPGIFDEAE